MGDRVFHHERLSRTFEEVIAELGGLSSALTGGATALATLINVKFMMAFLVTNVYKVEKEHKKCGSHHQD